MKKFFALCSMIVALGFVAGCGNGGAPATTPEPPAPATYNGGDAIYENGTSETSSDEEGTGE